MEIIISDVADGLSAVAGLHLGPGAGQAGIPSRHGPEPNGDARADRCADTDEYAHGGEYADSYGRAGSYQRPDPDGHAGPNRHVGADGNPGSNA